MKDPAPGVRRAPRSAPAPRARRSLVLSCVHQIVGQRRGVLSRGWWFEDFEVGAIFETARRTVTEADLVNFIGLGGFFEELFMNADARPENPYGRRIVPGYLTLVVAEGLFTLTGMMHRAVGLLGLNDVRWSAPVACGDTLTVQIRVSEARRSRKGGRGIVSTVHSVRKQDGTEVLSYSTARLIRTREPEIAAPE